jgi:hypothetical protein
MGKTGGTWGLKNKSSGIEALIGGEPRDDKSDISVRVISKKVPSSECSH